MATEASAFIADAWLGECLQLTVLASNGGRFRKIEFSYPNITFGLALARWLMRLSVSANESSGYERQAPRRWHRHFLPSVLCV